MTRDVEDDDEDRRAFREAIRGVRPLRAAPRVVPRARPRAQALFRRRDEQRVLEESVTVAPHELGVDTPDELLFRREGVQDTVLRRLRRGHYRVGAECDLHGLTVAQAKDELRQFLARAVARQDRCVRVIHGKGLGSGPRGPVVKAAVNAVLRRSSSVVAFCSARPVDGGTGAIYVLLSA
jgi:DNA-nicking Smr family endonuclease